MVSPPPALVTVQLLPLEKIKAGQGNKVKTETVLVLQFRGALIAGAANNVNAYELAPVITVKAKGKGKHKQPATTKLGTPVRRPGRLHCLEQPGDALSARHV